MEFERREDAPLREAEKRKVWRVIFMVLVLMLVVSAGIAYYVYYL